MTKVTLPFTATKRNGKKVTIVKFVDNATYPWCSDAGESFRITGHLYGPHTEDPNDIVEGLPMREVTIENELVHKTVFDTHKVLVTSTIIAHVAILCIGSILIHAILTTRYVAWFHDCIWPDAWVTVTAAPAEKTP